MKSVTPQTNRTHPGRFRGIPSPCPSHLKVVPNGFGQRGKEVNMTRRKPLMSLLALLLCCACASLPDVQPFATQTTRMSTAIGEGYTQTETLLLETQYGASQTAKLREDWKETRDALNAMVAYSDALAALADAGGKGREAAESVADAVQGVANVLGAGTIPELAVELFATINDEIAKIRARKDMADAVNAAQPAINIFAEIVAEKIRLLGILNAAAADEVLTQYELANQRLTDYYGQLEAADGLMVEQLTLILVLELSGGNDAEGMGAPRPEGAPVFDPRLGAISRTAEPQRRLELARPLKAEFLRASKDLRAEINRYSAPMGEYRAGRARIVTLRNNGTRIIASGGAAVTTWATTHSRLRVTLNKKTRLDVAAFAAAVGRIADAVVESETEQ